MTAPTAYDATITPVPPTSAASPPADPMSGPVVPISTTRTDAAEKLAASRPLNSRTRPPAWTSPATTLPVLQQASAVPLSTSANAAALLPRPVARTSTFASPSFLTVPLMVENSAALPARLMVRLEMAWWLPSKTAE